MCERIRVCVCMSMCLDRKKREGGRVPIRDG